jgi:hypothetical protein
MSRDQLDQPVLHRLQLIVHCLQNIILMRISSTQDVLPPLSSAIFSLLIELLGPDFSGLIAGDRVELCDA